MRQPSTAQELTGYLNVLKPPGMTSHDVVGRLRRLSGQRHLGHTGTLDPAAVGVLPVAFGRATRTVSSSLWDRKLYWADVGFGLSTDTDDAEGRPLATGQGENVELAAVTARLAAFVGVIEQRPPSFSAVHVSPGRRAYQQARQGAARGEGAGASLAPRRVSVDGIAIVGWRPPLLSLLVQCGSGTYLRALARDLGQAVECPAHLAALVRLRVGPFTAAEALDLRVLESIAEHAAWRRVLWPIDSLDLGVEEAIVVPTQRGDDFVHGRGWPQSTSAPADQNVRAYLESGAFLAFARSVGGRWLPSSRPGGSGA